MNVNKIKLKAIWSILVSLVIFLSLPAVLAENSKYMNSGIEITNLKTGLDESQEIIEFQGLIDGLADDKEEEADVIVTEEKSSIAISENAVPNEPTVNENMLNEESALTDIVGEDLWPFIKKLFTEDLANAAIFIGLTIPLETAKGIYLGLRSSYDYLGPNEFNVNLVCYKHSLPVLGEVGANLANENEIWSKICQNRVARAVEVTLLTAVEFAVFQGVFRLAGWGFRMLGKLKVPFARNISEAITVPRFAQKTKNFKPVTDSRGKPVLVQKRYGITPLVAVAKPIHWVTKELKDGMIKFSATKTGQFIGPIAVGGLSGAAYGLSACINNEEISENEKTGCMLQSIGIGSIILFTPQATIFLFKRGSRLVFQSNTAGAGLRADLASFGTMSKIITFPYRILVRGYFGLFEKATGFIVKSSSKRILGIDAANAGFIIWTGVDDWFKHPGLPGFGFNVGGVKFEKDTENLNTIYLDNHIDEENQRYTLPVHLQKITQARVDNIFNGANPFILDEEGNEIPLPFSIDNYHLGNGTSLMEMNDSWVGNYFYSNQFHIYSKHEEPKISKVGFYESGAWWRIETTPIRENSISIKIFNSEEEVCELSEYAIPQDDSYGYRSERFYPEAFEKCGISFKIRPIKETKALPLFTDDLEGIEIFERTFDWTLNGIPRAIGKAGEITSLDQFFKDHSTKYIISDFLMNGDIIDNAKTKSELSYQEILLEKTQTQLASVTRNYHTIDMSDYLDSYALNESSSISLLRGDFIALAEEESNPLESSQGTINTLRYLAISDSADGGEIKYVIAITEDEKESFIMPFNVYRVKRGVSLQEIDGGPSPNILTVDKISEFKDEDLLAGFVTDNSGKTYQLEDVTKTGRRIANYDYMFVTGAALDSFIAVSAMPSLKARAVEPFGGNRIDPNIHIFDEGRLVLGELWAARDNFASAILTFAQYNRDSFMQNNYYSKLKTWTSFEDELESNLALQASPKVEFCEEGQTGEAAFASFGLNRVSFESDFDKINPDTCTLWGDGQFCDRSQFTVGMFKSTVNYQDMVEDSLRIMDNDALAHIESDPVTKIQDLYRVTKSSMLVNDSVNGNQLFFLQNGLPMRNSPDSCDDLDERFSQVTNAIKEGTSQGNPLSEEQKTSIRNLTQGILNVCYSLEGKAIDYQVPDVSDVLVMFETDAAGIPTYLGNIKGVALTNFNSLALSNYSTTLDNYLDIVSNKTTALGNNVSIASLAKLDEILFRVGYENSSEISSENKEKVKILADNTLKQLAYDGSLLFEYFPYMDLESSYEKNQYLLKKDNYKSEQFVDHFIFTYGQDMVVYMSGLDTKSPVLSNLIWDINAPSVDNFESGTYNVLVDGEVEIKDETINIKSFKLNLERTMGLKEFDESFNTNFDNNPFLHTSFNLGLPGGDYGSKVEYQDNIFSGPSVILKLEDLENFELLEEKSTGINTFRVTDKSFYPAKIADGKLIEISKDGSLVNLIYKKSVPVQFKLESPTGNNTLYYGVSLFGGTEPFISKADYGADEENNSLFTWSTSSEKSFTDVLGDYQDEQCGGWFEERYYGKLKYPDTAINENLYSLAFLPEKSSLSLICADKGANLGIKYLSGEEVDLSASVTGGEFFKPGENLVIPNTVDTGKYGEGIEFMPSIETFLNSVGDRQTCITATETESGKGFDLAWNPAAFANIPYDEEKKNSTEPA